MIQQGEMVANAFDRVILYEDACNRGKARGEIIAMLRQGTDRGTR